MGETTQPPPADWEPPTDWQPPQPDWEPPSQPEKRRGFWQWRPAILRSFDELSRFAVNLGIVALFALVSLVIVEAALEQTIIVNPITVPKTVSDAGYDGTAMAQKLVALVGHLGEMSRSSRERAQFDRESRFADASTVRVPSSDLSVRSLVTLLRNFFGIPDSRITGELTIAYPSGTNAAPEFTLALYFVNGGKPSFYPPRKGGNLDRLIEEAALEIVEEFDPVTLGAYMLELSRLPPDDDTTHGAVFGSRFDGMISRLISKADEKTLPWLLNLQATRLTRGKHMYEAREIYLRMLHDYPTFGMGHAGMAAAIELGLLEGDPTYHGLSEAERRDLEYDHFRLALRYSPNTALIHNNLGEVYRVNKRPFDAIEEFRRAIELNPRYAFPYINWGVTLIQLADEKKPPSRQRLSEALDKFRRASELDARWSTSSVYRGYVLVRLAEPLSPTFRPQIEAAIATLRPVIERKPLDGEATFVLGYAHEHLGEYDAALGHYCKVIKLASVPKGDLFDDNEANPDKAVKRVLDALRQEGKTSKGCEK